MIVQDNLKSNLCSFKQVKQYLKLTKTEERQIKKVIEIHPMRITKYYLSLINSKDKDDPIKKMIIPSKQELDSSGTYDTSGEKQSTKKVGLQHKYKQTALILSTSRCSAYCRFCFRKRLVGLQSKEILQRFDDAVRYIRSHNEINNVLITGGDPFILKTEIIKKFLEKLSKIEHLDFIRFGTRVIVTFPHRIIYDATLFNLLKKFSRKDRRIFIVTHFNHPNEITEKSINAVDKLLKANVILKNQTVLLKGVNDNPEILAKLMRKLTSIGVNPYYIFQCRPVKRVKHHFQVPLYKGLKIVEDAKKKLSGINKPIKYIMSHRSGKTEIIGIMHNEIYFKYHQARNSKNIGKFFKRKLDKKATWLDDLK